MSVTSRYCNTLGQHRVSRTSEYKSAGVESNVSAKWFNYLTHWKKQTNDSQTSSHEELKSMICPESNSHFVLCSIPSTITYGCIITTQRLAAIVTLRHYKILSIIQPVHGHYITFTLNTLTLFKMIITL